MLTNPAQPDLLMQQFLQHVELTPNKMAVVGQSQSARYTYKQFNNAVNAFAKGILTIYGETINKKIDAGEQLNIGIQFESKSTALLVFFAVLKIGGTCVVINTNDPEDRRNFVIEKSGLAFNLNENTLPEYLGELLWDLDPTSMENQNYEEPAPIYEQSDLRDRDAYILFTSGSTASQPKGVRQTRYGLWGQIQAYTKDLKITSEDCLLNLATFSHDQAMVDCFGALLNGSTLCLYQPNNLQTSQLHEFMKVNKISIFSSIPTMFAFIFENITEKSTFPSLRIVTIGGEETKRSHIEIFQQSCPAGASLVNGYGATEGSWFSYYYIPDDINLNELTTIPLGYATDSLKVRLMKLEDSDTLFELCVASRFLSPGYYNNEEATEKAFFIDQGERYYRTGDLASIDVDQCLHFLGRKVWHEKISGKRVNLLEVEHALHQTGFPSDTVVMAYGDDEKRRLYVFHTLSPEQAYSIVNLKYILPDYMIPKKAFSLEELPKLPNGKINRQALLKKLDDLIAYKPCTINKTDEISEVLAKKWRNSLELPDDFDITNSPDSFKELGGNSMGMSRLINNLNHYFKTEHQLDLMLEPVLLEQYQNYSDFKDYLLKKCYQVANKHDNSYEKAIFKMPSMKMIPLRNYEYLDASGKSTRKNPESVLFDFNALEIIVKLINEEHKVDIRLGRSYDEIISVIKNAIDAESGPSQIGLMLLKSYALDSHLTPAILCIDRENKEYTLLVSEAIESEITISSRWMESNGILRKIQDTFPNMKFGFEFSKRQEDAVSCSIDGVLYLLEALKIGMLNNIQYTSATINDDLSKLNNPFMFISPPQLFKTAMIDLPAQLDANALIISDGKELPLNDFIAQNQTKLFAQIRNQEERRMEPFKPMLINTYVWKEALAFNQLLKRLLEQIQPDLLAFTVYFTSVFPVEEKIYLHRELINEKTFLQDLERYVSTLIPERANVRYLIAGNEILHLEHLMKHLAQANASPLAICVVTDLDLKKEAADIKKFIEQYKKFNPQISFSLFGATSHSDTVLINPGLSLKTIYMEALKGNEKVIKTLESLWWMRNGKCDTKTPHLLLAFSQASKELNQSPTLTQSKNL